MSVCSLYTVMIMISHRNSSNAGQFEYAVALPICAVVSSLFWRLQYTLICVSATLEHHMVILIWKPRSPIQLLFTHKEAADKGKEHHSNHECKAFIHSPSVTAPNHFRNTRIKSLDKVKTLTHAVNDPVNILAIAQCRPQPAPENLLDHC